MSDSAGKPWAERMADELCGLEGNLTTEMAQVALEAAAEMKCVALKIALARCYEIINESRRNNTAAGSTEDFEAYLLELVGNEGLG